MAHSIGEGSSSVKEGLSSVNEGSPSFTRSVFDAVKAPALSDLTRKRSVHCKRRTRGEGSSEPNSITASQRVKEFPEECLEVTGARKSKLFCKACREELILKKNIIVSHMSSAQSCTTLVMTVFYSATFFFFFFFLQQK